MCEVVYYGYNRRGGGVKLPDWLLQKLFQRKDLGTWRSQFGGIFIWQLEVNFKGIGAKNQVYLI